MKIVLRLGVTARRGAVLKGHSIRKVEYHCFRPMRMAKLSLRQNKGVDCAEDVSFRFQDNYP